MTKISHLLIFLPFILLLGRGEGTKDAKTRDPRLFYVSTTTSTTTVLTATICFMTTNAALTTACGKRRKRFVNAMVPLDGNIDPSRFVISTCFYYYYIVKLSFNFNFNFNLVES